MSLSQSQKKAFEANGHLTVDDVFSGGQMASLLADIDVWSADVIAAMSEEDKAWYVDDGVKTNDIALRKMDDPVFYREAFRSLACHHPLVEIAEQLIGPNLSVAFSQVFMKPAAGGGPKPIHQDNFYFGPTHIDGMVTAWVAIDSADVDNGCLFYGDGSQREAVHTHVAPKAEPYNLALPDTIAAGYSLTPAPVRSGGVSFHHGNTYHQSGPNTSQRSRRAVAFHYVNGKTTFDYPTLTYNRDHVVPIS